jgi:tetratricopeptide (TPR) repeat protein
MTEKNRREFVLEVVKTLCWPLLAVIGVLWFGNDLKDILKNRTWKIGVIEVGDRITGFENTLQEALQDQHDYLVNIKRNAGDKDEVTKLAEKAAQQLTNAQRGVTKDIQNIQQAIPQTQGINQEESSEKMESKSSITSPKTARDWEVLGFSYILARDVRAAIDAFSQAEKIWPDYHNVSEIRRALVRDSHRLAETNSPEWKSLYRRVLSELSWGMPPSVRQSMLNYLGNT